MSATRRCWIDDGTSPIYEALLSDIKDGGATVVVEDGKSLPATFKVYFDEGFNVGRTGTVDRHEGGTYFVLFTGRAPRPVS